MTDRQPTPGPADLAAMSDLIMPMAIRVAATLHLADHLADGPLTTTALATRAGADPSALARLMQYLVARGLFESASDEEERKEGAADQPRAGRDESAAAGRDESAAAGRDESAAAGRDESAGVGRGEGAGVGRGEGAGVERAGGVESGDRGRFALGDGGRWLLDGAPGSARKWLDLEGFGGHMDRAFFELLGTVRAGGPVAAGNKMSLSPGAAESYDELMAERARAEGPALAQALNWGRFKHVVDVGGGTGAQLIALLSAFPHLRGTLVELPASITTAQQHFTEAGVGCAVLAGDLFELELPRADAFVLRYLLHSFEDEQAVEALAKCRKALDEGGSVLVCEASDASPAVFASMDLLMLVLGHGRERTLAQYDDVAAAAGLTRKAIYHPTAGPRVLEYAV
ncbi:methyltransferase [Kribbella sp. NPDC051620]|uniref:methyltransferase n=1 Tax=Kribbella sp. NPDC051620 TaxID=3364120 RepID=UPI0037A66B7F